MKNRVNIVGRVGQTPEVKYLEGGTPVAKFTLATTEKYKNAKGEVVTETQWHSVTAWRKLAEIVEKYVQKGQLLDIEGKIKYSKSEKDGKTTYFTEIVAKELMMFPKTQASEPKADSNYPATPEESYTAEQQVGSDDLPF